MTNTESRRNCMSVMTMLTPRLKMTALASYYCQVVNKKDLTTNITIR
ncbi:hypothetical protein [Veillonella parvula]